MNRYSGDSIVIHMEKCETGIIYRFSSACACVRAFDGAVYKSHVVMLVSAGRTVLVSFIARIHYLHQFRIIIRCVCASVCMLC